MAKNSITIPREIVAQFSTISNLGLNLPEGKPFKFNGLVLNEDQSVKMGTYGFGSNKTDSPVCAVHVHGEKEPREIPFKAILNMAFITKKDVLNEGTVAECIKNLGHRVGEVLLKKEGAEFEFPKEITVVKRFKTGVNWKTLKSAEIRANYQAVAEESGKTYEEVYDTFETAPILFKNSAGSVNFNQVYGVQPW